MLRDRNVPPASDLVKRDLTAGTNQWCVGRAWVISPISRPAAGFLYLLVMLDAVRSWW